jgi:hypothetical protein
MTVAASIILAAVVGGVIFVLLDSWQRRAAAPTPAMPAPRPRVATAWQPPPRQPRPVEPRPRPAWERPTWDHDDRYDDEDPPTNLWSGWASRNR